MDAPPAMELSDSVEEYVAVCLQGEVLRQCNKVDGSSHGTAAAPEPQTQGRATDDDGDATGTGSHTRACGEGASCCGLPAWQQITIFQVAGSRSTVWRCAVAVVAAVLSAARLNGGLPCGPARKPGAGGFGLETSSLHSGRGASQGHRTAAVPTLPPQRRWRHHSRGRALTRT